MKGLTHPATTTRKRSARHAIAVALASATVVWFAVGMFRVLRSPWKDASRHLASGSVFDDLLREVDLHAPAKVPRAWIVAGSDDPAAWYTLKIDLGPIANPARLYGTTWSALPPADADRVLGRILHPAPQSFLPSDWSPNSDNPIMAWNRPSAPTGQKWEAVLSRGARGDTLFIRFEGQWTDIPPPVASVMKSHPINTGFPSQGGQYGCQYP